MLIAHLNRLLSRKRGLICKYNECSHIINIITQYYRVLLYKENLSSSLVSEEHLCLCESCHLVSRCRVFPPEQQEKPFTVLVKSFNALEEPSEASMSGYYVKVSGGMFGKFKAQQASCRSFCLSPNYPG